MKKTNDLFAAIANTQTRLRDVAMAACDNRDPERVARIMAMIRSLHTMQRTIETMMQYDE